jgi:membrane protease YdiL (CAAX protease family)
VRGSSFEPVASSVLRPTDRRSAELGALFVLVGSVTLLLDRPGLSTNRSAPLVLLALYLAIGGASVAADVGRAERPAVLTPSTVLLLGLLALGAVTWVARSPVPIRWSPWAPVLGVFAAVAEEALFRRLAYGRLLRFGVPVAIVGSAVAFALLHVPLYGVAVLPVDLGAGLLLSWQRWACGTWTVPAATHAAANLLAVIR